MTKKHLTYFMKPDLYRAAKDASEIFPCLEESEWLGIIHHIHAHELTLFPQNKGNLLRCLGDHDISYFCLDTLKDYLWANSGPNHKFPIISPEERPLWKKVRNLYNYIIHNYQEVNIGKDGKVRWKVVNVRPRS